MNAISSEQQDGYGRMSLRAGATLFHEGSLGSAAYLIEAGEIEIFVARDGDQVLLARRGPGELIGEVAVIDGGPRSASARATSDCRLIVIEAAQLEARAGRSDRVLRMCLQLVLARYRDAMARVRSVSLAPVSIPRRLPIRCSPRRSNRCCWSASCAARWSVTSSSCSSSRSSVSTAAAWPGSRR